MWRCSGCQREFAKVQQAHYCSATPETIDAYIAAKAEAVQPYLIAVRDVLRSALPQAKERIAWQMPTFYKTKNIIHFAAFNKHLGLYPGAEAIVHFAEKLTEYKTSKGAVQFPYSKDFPLALIAEMAKWCEATGNHH